MSVSNLVRAETAGANGLWHLSFYWTQGSLRTVEEKAEGEVSL